MKANDVTYDILCSNCKCTTPHIIENKLESEIETISPNFLSELFNFLLSIDALDTNDTSYTCSICSPNAIGDE
jgi:hypothetical protein